jgi:hypothetical protein
MYSTGARRLPAHHITIRVPWHDGGWSGSVCAHPEANTSCLILPRIGTSKDDEAEVRCAGKHLDELAAVDLPPCADEEGAFMAPRAGIQPSAAYPYDPGGGLRRDGRG